MTLFYGQNEMEYSSTVVETQHFCKHTLLTPEREKQEAKGVNLLGTRGREANHAQCRMGRDASHSDKKGLTPAANSTEHAECVVQNGTVIRRV